MYIEKLGRNNRQIDSKLLQFVANYYNIDYLKLRMSSKLANKLDGYRSYAVNCKNTKGEKINTLIWFSDFEFGTLNAGEKVDVTSYLQYMATNLGESSQSLLEDFYDDLNSTKHLKEGM